MKDFFRIILHYTLRFISAIIIWYFSFAIFIKIPIFFVVENGERHLNSLIPLTAPFVIAVGVFFLIAIPLNKNKFLSNPLVLRKKEPKEGIKMFCSNCGNKLPENSRFCNNCGAQTTVDANAKKIPLQPTQSNQPTHIKSCPKCKSTNIQFQTVTESRKTGCLEVLLYIFLAVTIIGWLILIPLALRKNTYTVTYNVCQNCGNRWRGY